MTDKRATSVPPTPLGFRVVAGASGQRPERRNGALDRRLISACDAAISKTLQEQASAVLAILTPRERHVLRLRFGVRGVDGRAAAESDAEITLTREEIESIETETLRKLRHPGCLARRGGVVRA